MRFSHYLSICPLNRPLSHIQMEVVPMSQKWVGTAVCAILLKAIGQKRGEKRSSAVRLP